MSEKVFKLIVAIIGGVSAIASGLVAYFDPHYSVAIISAIAIIQAAAVEVCELFKDKEIANNQKNSKEKFVFDSKK